MDDKLTGSYYTPHNVVRFMVEYLHKQGQDFSNVLEPSAGDGRFIDLLQNYGGIRITGLELYKKKVDYMKQKNCVETTNIIQKDFLDYARQTNNKYNLVIGNPPYINLKNMKQTSVEKAKKLCKCIKIKSSVIQNVWVAFVLASVKVLAEKGSIFFVLPLEFLQVQYAEVLREYLEKHFNTIHIISFNEAVFSDIEQDVCLVYLTNRNEALPYISYQIYENPDEKDAIKTTRIERNKPLKKWSNAILSDDDIEMINKIGKSYIKIDEMGDSSPGIVTGGNKYFIVNRKFLDKYKCENMSLPIIQKSSLLKNKLLLTDELVESLDKSNANIYLLDLIGVNESEMSPELINYLNEIGTEKNSEGIELKKRYKCSKRNPWYGVPIVKNGDIVFFKRYDKMPRVCINDIGIHTTDIGYNLRLKEIYDKNSVGFCFYNSLSLAQCEFLGRYYGGGVSELVPSEFKQVSIPYRKINRKDIERLDKLISNGSDTQNIVDFVNSKTIGHDLDKSTIDKLDEIRIMLMKRRIKM